MMRFILLSFLLFCVAVGAQTPAVESPVAKKATQTKAKKPEKPKPTKLFCPPVNKLTKKGDWWGAAGDWRSYSQSFVNQLSGFIGAQWVGVNVGTMICIYQGGVGTSFPVTIQNSTLVPSPKGAGWGIYRKGRKSCYSSNVNDCPYYFYPKAKPKNIYQILESFKQKPNSQSKP